jgi:hypothetical protein
MPPRAQGSRTSCAASSPTKAFSYGCKGGLRSFLCEGSLCDVSKCAVHWVFCSQIQAQQSGFHCNENPYHEPFYYKEPRTGASNYDPFLLQRIKGTGAPSLHTGLFIAGAELLSPRNEQSLLGDRNLRYLRFFVVKRLVVLMPHLGFFAVNRKLPGGAGKGFLYQQDLF